jgi:hypothetical protein
MLAIRPEVDALIVAAKRTLEHNETACDSLDMARLLLSLGHPELAVVKIRDVLLQRRDRCPAPEGLTVKNLRHQRLSS